MNQVYAKEHNEAFSSLVAKLQPNPDMAYYRLGWLFIITVTISRDKHCNAGLVRVDIEMLAPTTMDGYLCLASQMPHTPKNTQEPNHTKMQLVYTKERCYS